MVETNSEHYQRTVIDCGLLKQPLRNNDPKTMFNKLINYSKVNYNYCVYVCTLRATFIMLTEKRFNNIFTNGKREVALFRIQGPNYKWIDYYIFTCHGKVTIFVQKTYDVKVIPHAFDKSHETA